MSSNISEKEIRQEIEILNEIFKSSSKELIECRSMTREQELRSKMYECEVKKRIFLRKLQKLESRSVSA